MRPAADAEKLGIPSVVITVKGFTAVAEEAAEAAGVKGLRSAAYPGAVGVHSEEIRKNIKENLFEQIVDGLTKPEADDAVVERRYRDAGEIVYKGTVEEISEFFSSNDWNARYAHPEALSAHEKVELGIYPKDYLVGQDEMVRVLPSPEILHIVVCGDVSRNRVMTLWGGYVKPATKAIELPANWDALLGAVRQPEIIETGSHV